MSNLQCIITFLHLPYVKMFSSLFTLETNIELVRNKDTVLKWVFHFVNFKGNLFTDLKCITGGMCFKTTILNKHLPFFIVQFSLKL